MGKHTISVDNFRYSDCYKIAIAASSNKKALFIHTELFPFKTVLKLKQGDKTVGNYDDLQKAIDAYNELDG